ncbi:MAG: ribosomal protein S18-alanine N-acetyltransferase [Clostridia bacterium]|nr:ribosomal protein S18-alanine N-acetyltransferase [Clostridia bacterium]
MKITVDRATYADIPFIAALEKETFSMPQSEKELEKMIASDTNLLLVARYDGAFSGYIGAYTVCRESDIVTVATSPLFRRKGVAKELLTALFDNLRGVSDTVFLEVRESNVAARTLYQSLGFGEIGIRRGYYKNPSENAVLYKKDV